MEEFVSQNISTVSEHMQSNTKSLILSISINEFGGQNHPKYKLSSVKGTPQWVNLGGEKDTMGLCMNIFQNRSQIY